VVTATGLMIGCDTGMNPLVNSVDFNQRPFIAIWEVTQACDLACHPMELTTAEGKALISQIAALEVPVFVLTGGDPSSGPTCLN
jgi:AdoMet-dependent heme synthase